MLLLLSHFDLQQHTTNAILFSNVLTRYPWRVSWRKNKHKGTKLFFMTCGLIPITQDPQNFQKVFNFWLFMVEKMYTVQFSQLIWLQHLESDVNEILMASSLRRLTNSCIYNNASSLFLEKEVIYGLVLILTFLISVIVNPCCQIHDRHQMCFDNQVTKNLKSKRGHSNTHRPAVPALGR